MFDRLKKLFHKKAKKEPIRYDQEMVRESAGQSTVDDSRINKDNSRPLCHDNDFSLKWRRFEAQVKEAKQERIAEANRKRQTSFSYSEHFKQRQPTTARKLWKPGIKPEEKED